jgi:hypothetical protein
MPGSQKVLLLLVRKHGHQRANGNISRDRRQHEARHLAQAISAMLRMQATRRCHPTEGASTLCRPPRHDAVLRSRSYICGTREGHECNVTLHPVVGTPTTAHYMHKGMQHCKAIHPTAGLPAAATLPAHPPLDYQQRLSATCKTDHPCLWTLTS